MNHPAAEAPARARPRPAPRVQPVAAPHAPATDLPSQATDLLDLQRVAGNTAVTALVRRTAPALHVIGRAPVAPPAAGPVQKVIDAIDKTGGADITAAFNVLTPLPMYDLLPTLQGVAAAGKLGPIEANASVLAGPRMVLALKIVKLKQAGTKLTEAVIDGLIDDMSTSPADQRTDMLRFLGLPASVTVQGFEVTFAYTAGTTGPSCEADLVQAIAWAKKMQGEYAACGAKKGLKTGSDVEACVDASLKAQGISTSVAGSTSSSGTVSVAVQAITKSQPILTRGTEIHEAEHAAHTLALQAKFGGKTAAFQKVWDSADDWWRDEVRAYGSEIPFYEQVIAAIKKLEKLKKP